MVSIDAQTLICSDFINTILIVFVVIELINVTLINILLSFWKKIHNRKKQHKQQKHIVSFQLKKKKKRFKMVSSKLSGVSWNDTWLYYCVIRKRVALVLVR